MPLLIRKFSLLLIVGLILFAIEMKTLNIAKLGILQFLEQLLIIKKV